MIQQKSIFLFVLGVLLLVGFIATAAEPSIHGKLKADAIFQDSNGLAIGGFDPVAYFEQGKPVSGSAEFEYKWHSATWRFVNTTNRDLFTQDPERYSPQYGGYCAYGMSHGYAAPTEPDAWTVLNGKLYLNYNKDVQTEWNKKKSEYIAQADRNWPKIPKKPIED